MVFSYSYPALPLAGKYIRVVTLHPGSPSDIIRVILHETPSNADELSTYETLSYVSGSAENRSRIRV